MYFLNPNRVLVVVSCVAVAFVSACAAPPLKNNQLMTDTSLITGEPCAAPCWQGIVPGQTTWNEAVTLLDTLPGLTIMETRETRGSRYATFATEAGVTCCELLSEDGETVSRVLLRYAPQMTLSEVISTYGEPSYVKADPYTNEEAVGTLIYPDIPMVIAFYLAGIETGEIAPSSEVIGSYLATEADVAGVIAASALYKWEGYRSYASYTSRPFDQLPNTEQTASP